MAWQRSLRGHRPLQDKWRAEGCAAIRSPDGAFLKFAAGMFKARAAKGQGGRLRASLGEAGQEQSPIGLLFQFNLEAWIRLDVVNDLVIADHKIGDRDATPVSAELAQLIKVERDELLNLEHVDPVGQAGVVREAFRDGQTPLPGRKPSLRLSRQRSITASPGDVVT